MTRHAARRHAIHRSRAFLGAAATMTAALVLATFSGAPGTRAQWADAAQLMTGTITSGSPNLSVTGFDGLDYEYEVLGPYSTSATITVANTGNTPLHGFSASQTLVSGNANLASAVSPTFTGNGQVNVPVSTWLSGLTLAPGASAQYTATTTLPLADIALLALTQADIDIEVTATAGTSWNLLAIDGYAQGVLEAPSTQDDFNATIAWPVPWPSSGAANFGFTWSPSYEGTTFPGNTGWLIYTNGYEVSEDHGTHPQYGIHLGVMNAAAVPPVGQTAQIVVTVVPNIPGWATPIMQLTVWMTTVNSGYALFFLSDPTASSASAPISALAAPLQTPAAPESQAQAPAAPSAPPVAPAPDKNVPAAQPNRDPATSSGPGPTPPSAPTPAPDTAADPTPEPAPEPTPGAATPPAEPAEPTAPPAETPQPTPEAPAAPAALTVTEGADAAEGELDLSWQPQALAAGTSYRVELNGTALDSSALSARFDPTVGRLTLRPGDLPAELQPAPSSSQAFTVSIVATLAGGNEQVVATGTAWTAAGADGAVTLHAHDASG